MSRYYDTAAIGTGCKQVAYVKIITNPGDFSQPIEYVPGMIQQYLTEFGGWQDFTYCYVFEVNGKNNQLVVGKRYLAVRYPDDETLVSDTFFGPGTPIFGINLC